MIQPSATGEDSRDAWVEKLIAGREAEAKFFGMRETIPEQTRAMAMGESIACGHRANDAQSAARVFAGILRVT